MKEYLIISSSVELLRVALEDIIFISSDGNYSSIVLTNGESRMVTLQLGQLEKMISERVKRDKIRFIRAGKSLIINCEYIFFINLSKQQIVLTDGRLSTHTLTASKDALKRIKEAIENEIL
ncbi:MAG: LytTR family transcriptional regulator DNA-binding domain-containing protein [Bacteroidales bacterium]|nr:LytTR family transcriptional regulator DNA-binding domain-containing protein [Bacteroidales bacterium]MCR5191801.1 LytTR family transcriptional regulator DNA-binding domain-containing protein [Bacteroidales bacterium]